VIVAGEKNEGKETARKIYGHHIWEGVIEGRPIAESREKGGEAKKDNEKGGRGGEGKR